MNNTLKIIGSTLACIVGICGSLWFFGEPFLEDYVDQRIDQYIESPKFIFFVDNVIEIESKKAEQKQIEKDSNKIGLRVLFSDKMGVPKDEVHIEIGKLYRNEKDFKEETKEAIEKIKEKLRSLTLSQ